MVEVWSSGRTTDFYGTVAQLFKLLKLLRTCKLQRPQGILSLVKITTLFLSRLALLGDFCAQDVKLGALSESQGFHAGLKSTGFN